MSRAGLSAVALNISVIIPVLHEQERINALITRVREQTDEPFEIIVVDGDTAGSTISGVSDRSVVTMIAAQGRGNQLAAGAARATGEIILMAHADTALPDNGLQIVSDAVADGAEWGAFRLGIDATDIGFRLIERLVDLRCKLFTLPYGDQAIFVTRSALDSCGGIPAIPLMEDVALARNLFRSGKCFSLLPQRVQTSARRWQKDGILKRTINNWWLLLRYLSGTDPVRLAQEYR